MAAFIGAFIWLYTDTVNKTSLSSRIAGLQTLATEEGKQMVLSVTLERRQQCQIPDQTASSRQTGGDRRDKKPLPIRKGLIVGDRKIGHGAQHRR